MEKWEKHAFIIRYSYFYIHSCCDHKEEFGSSFKGNNDNVICILIYYKYTYEEVTPP